MACPNIWVQFKSYKVDMVENRDKFFSSPLQSVKAKIHPKFISMPYLVLYVI